jgi:protein-tyrosine phosphatase
VNLDPTERRRHGGADEIPLPRGPGRLWLCGKHFIGPDPEAALAVLGATTVVCLNQEPELAERYPDYVAWLRAEAPDRAVWFPIPDLHAPDVAVMRPLFEGLCERLDEGERLLLHCGAGIGRAGTMAAGILLLLGATSSEALDTVAAHRPMAGPEAGAQRNLLLALADVQLG